LPFFQTRLGVFAKATALANVGQDDDGPCATGDLAFEITRVATKFKRAQLASPSQSPVRSTWPAGWIVETACL
jgi:hypothetical protein